MPEHTDLPERPLTVEQVADLLQLGKRTVYRMIERKELPAMKVGRQWRVARATLDKYLQPGASEGLQ